MINLIELLALGVRKGASDLHISAGVAPLVRVDGDIRPLAEVEGGEDSVGVPEGGEESVGVPGQMSEQGGGQMGTLRPLTDEEAEGLVLGVMTEEQRGDYERGKEVDFAFEVEGVARFRVNVFRQRRGVGAVFRVIPAEVLSMERLGMGEVFRRIAEARRGLVVVTGPTGSGKSTTLAAMIHHINQSRREHILTVEDPIEFVHRSDKCLVNQREVGRHTHGFSEALRAALREDPDIILVGELRDLETIRLALTAAETGHLVFATLHTVSAAKTVDRIIDVFPAGEKDMVRSMLSESLHSVISQTLLKKVGGGRVAAYEIMLATAAVRNLIRENKVAQMQSVIQTGAAAGMQTLEQCRQRLLAEGVVAEES